MGLKCTVPGCKHVINAFTGFQEIEKLRKHMGSKHLVHWGTMRTLEERSLMEGGGIPKTPYVLITTNKHGKVLIKRLRDDRHKIHGFGTFFWNMKPDELVITDNAWMALSRCVNRRYSSHGDLFGIDIGWVGMEAITTNEDPKSGIDPSWRGMLVNYGFAGKQLAAPEEDVTVDPKAWELLQKTQGRGL